MGSDMAMERITTVTYPEWEMIGDHQHLMVYRRSSYDGKKVAVLSFAPEDVDDILINTINTLTGAKVPDRPEPVRSLETRIKGVIKEWSPCDGHGDPLDYISINRMVDDIIDEVNREL